MTFSPDDLRICAAVPEHAAPGAPLPASVPMVQTALFTHASFGELLEGLRGEHEHTVYTRGLNPTVAAAARCIADLERGDDCLCFASGMAAISAVLLGLLRSGDHVLFVNDVYGPTRALATELRRFGIAHDVVLDTTTAAVAAALRPETRMVWTESPGTMLFRQVDLRALAELAHAHGALACIDNSCATPLLQKPLLHGFDVVVHSASKYLSGHSDLMAGAVVARRDIIAELFGRSFMLYGGILAPFEAWLLLRGIRTLPVRLRQQGADAQRIATYLRNHAAVRAVHLPASGAHSPNGQLSGTPGMLSFELEDGSFGAVQRVIDRLRHFRIAVSWGGTESLVIAPNRGDNDADLRAAGIPPGLIRLSTGLEGAELLIGDLERALAEVAQ